MQRGQGSRRVGAAQALRHNIERQRRGAGAGEKGPLILFKSHHCQLAIQYNFEAGLACWVGGALLATFPEGLPRAWP